MQTQNDSKKKIPGDKAIVKVEGGRAFLRRPDIEKAKRELDFALGYWKLEREAIPTKNALKCKACAYSKLCDSKPTQAALS